MSPKNDYQEQAERQDGGRPRYRPNSGCLAGFLYFMFVVGISTFLASMGWLAARDVLGLMKEEKVAAIEIPEHYTIGEVAGILKDAGIIEYPSVFKMYARFSHADEKIDPGKYELSATLDYRAIVYAMRASSGARETIRLTIPEGFELRQIAQLLAEKEVCTEADFWETAQSHAFEYDFLAELPFSRTRLEGYLYPDTYDFYIGENPITVINKMLSNFNRKFHKDLRERMQELGLSFAEVVTMASLVEREAANDDEKWLVASVIRNRLDSSDYPYLQIDATIQYILPQRKERLTQEDLDIDSPYNSYKYEGLPPGPIACPGLEAIRAALYPEDTNYYFYALTSEGVHAFTRTAAEHQQVIRDNPEIYGER